MRFTWVTWAEWFRWKPASDSTYFLGKFLRILFVFHQQTTRAVSRLQLFCMLSARTPRCTTSFRYRLLGVEVISGPKVWTLTSGCLIWNFFIHIRILLSLFWLGGVILLCQVHFCLLFLTLICIFSYWRASERVCKSVFRGLIGLDVANLFSIIAALCFCSNWTRWMCCKSCSTSLTLVLEPSLCISGFCY